MYEDFNAQYITLNSQRIPTGKDLWQLIPYTCMQNEIYHNLDIKITCSLVIIIEYTKEKCKNNLWIMFVWKAKLSHIDSNWQITLVIPELNRCLGMLYLYVIRWLILSSIMQSSEHGFPLPLLLYCEMAFIAPSIAQLNTFIYHECVSAPPSNASAS